MSWNLFFALRHKFLFYEKHSKRIIVIIFWMVFKTYEYFHPPPSDNRDRCISEFLANNSNRIESDYRWIFSLEFKCSKNIYIENYLLRGVFINRCYGYPTIVTHLIRHTVFYGGQVSSEEKNTTIFTRFLTFTLWIVDLLAQLKPLIVYYYRTVNSNLSVCSFCRTSESRTVSILVRTTVERFLCSYLRYSWRTILS